MTDKITEETLNNFRKRHPDEFFIPENFHMFSSIANTPLWLRQLYIDIGAGFSDSQICSYCKKEIPLNKWEASEGACIDCLAKFSD